MHASARSEAFWRKFRRYQGVNEDHFAVTRFKTSPEVAERLLAMVVAGAKRATASPMDYFGDGRQEALPRAEDYVVLEDSQGRPQLIWRTTQVDVQPISAVTERYLWNDGEGEGDRSKWLAALRGSFTRQARQHGFEMHDDIETMFEHSK
jgi:uncharacterized protein YhfF